ncbi:MAG: Ig-like domain repeat protein [Chloroflexi bacterium]|nr:Ig-like domain repeat protein [Chloroflexota bacterium]
MRAHSLVSASRSVLSRWLFVLALVLVALLPTTARAADPVILRVKVGGGAATCGDLADWSNACDLQYALKTRADTSGGATYELWVAAGTYKPTTGTDRTVTFQLKSGVALYGGFAGTETLLNQRDWATNETILSGDLKGDDSGDVTATNPTRSDNSYHVVTGSGTDITAVLDGFTVTGGNANGASLPNDAGGGMDNMTGSPTLTNLTFSGNSAVAGGGMYNNGSSPTLTNVTFTSNSATYGGGMIGFSNSNPTLTNVTFSSNSAVLNGGGMYNRSSSPTLANVTFSGNSANSGGGMIGFSNSNPTLTNVTFSSNSAVLNGGGMYNDGSSPKVTNVTFSGNSANNYGGGMFNWSYSSPTMGNTILWGNTAPTGGAQIYNGGASTLVINDSVVQGGCPDASSTCSNVIPQDPHLGPLGDYGGATQTIPLLPGSSAIDAGNDAACPTTDQRGITRAGHGAHCDIGAFESRGFSLTKTGGDHQSTEATKLFALPLGLSVSSAYGEPVNGGVLTFSAPSSGASINPASNTATIVGAAVSKSLTANSLVGSYPVIVNASGVGSPMTFTLTNLKASTITTLTASPSPSYSGQAVTFRATVSGASPTGSVTLKEGGIDVTGCTAIPLSSGSTTCRIASLAIGVHTLTAVYSGDANNLGSTSNTLTQTVRPVLFLPLLVR